MPLQFGIIPRPPVLARAQHWCRATFLNSCPHAWLVLKPTCGVFVMLMSSGNGDSTDIGRSVMKWGRDGELSVLDLRSILERLSAVDEQAAGLMDCPLNPPN